MVIKKKSTKKKTTKRTGRVGEDKRVRRKYKKGGRIEAYTFGEAQRSKTWP